MIARLVAGSAAAFVAAGPCLAADTYLIDRTHAWVQFSIKQSPWASYLGTFHDLSGTIVFDRENLAASSVKAAIVAASLDTSDKDRDSGEAQLPGFLNSEAFPKITYESTAVVKTGEKTGKISGNLAMAGYTVPVVLDVTFNGEGISPWDGRPRVGFSATGSLSTNDFGMTGLVPLSIGPQLDFRIEVQAFKKP